MIYRVGSPVVLTISCAKCTHELDLEAYTTITPGLVIQPPFSRSDCDCGASDEPRLGSWTVTHERSGGMIGHYPDPETAQAAAAQFGPICDWTLTGSDVRALIEGDESVRATFRAIATPARALRIPDSSHLMSR